MMISALARGELWKALSAIGEHIFDVLIVVLIFFLSMGLAAVELLL